MEEKGRERGREGVSEREKAGKEDVHIWTCSTFTAGGSCSDLHKGQYVDLLEGGKVVVMGVMAAAHCRHFIAVSVPEKPNTVREASQSVFRKDLQQQQKDDMRNVIKEFLSCKVKIVPMFLFK